MTGRPDEPEAASDAAQASDGFHVKLVLQYDGTDFHGWQRQPGVRTVQGVLEEALAALYGKPIATQGTSRTDAGVHAEGQAVSLTCPPSVPFARIARALHGRLPDDVRIRSVEEVASDFDARRSAFGKHYRYTIDVGPLRDVFARRWALHVDGVLDVDRMREAAGAFVGEQDYAAFQCASDQAPPDTVREVLAVAIDDALPNRLFVHVLGRSFLYKMVRSMVGTLVDVGAGRRPPEFVRAALLARDRRAAGATAPARGLTLVEVFWDELNLGRAAVRLGTARSR